MSRLRQIKAVQIAAAEEAGQDGPYAQVQSIASPEVTPGRLQQIKQQQLAESEKTGVNPYPAGAASSAAVAAPRDLEHYQAAMGADLARLSTIKDVFEKAKAKAAMLATYLPFVNDYISKGDNYPNDIAVRVCIWLFDILDIERALNLAFVLIKQNQVTPPKFDRDLVTFVCDAMYDYANVILKLDQSASPYLDQVIAVMDEDKWSLAPPVQSKMYTMLAKHKKREGKWDECLALCEKAEQVNPEGAGVMTMKKEALAKLKPASEQSDKTGTDDPESTGDKDARGEATDTEQQNSDPSE
jgi:hypothetical protein